MFMLSKRTFPLFGRISGLHILDNLVETTCLQRHSIGSLNTYLCLGVSVQSSCLWWPLLSCGGPELSVECQGRVMTFLVEGSQTAQSSAHFLPMGPRQGCVPDFLLPQKLRGNHSKETCHNFYFITQQNSFCSAFFQDILHYLSKNLNFCGVFWRVCAPK